MEEMQVLLECKVYWDEEEECLLLEMNGHPRLIQVPTSKKAISRLEKALRKAYVAASRKAYVAEEITDES